jgi:hypothetical protein
MSAACNAIHAAPEASTATAKTTAAHRDRRAGAPRLFRSRAIQTNVTAPTIWMATAK